MLKKKENVPEFAKQVHEIIDKMPSGVTCARRDACSAVYEVVKSHLGGFPLEVKYYQIWSLPNADKIVTLSPRTVYCLIEMTKCLKNEVGYDSEAFWINLLDSVSTYEVQPEPISEWQCHIFVAFYELGAEKWPKREVKEPPVSGCEK